jgi:allantoate deiminase
MGINLERLKSNLLALGEIGKNPGGGVTRVSFSKEDKAARQLIKKLMEEAALDVMIDNAGNIIGRKKGKYESLPVVVTGSHIDTVINGGHFDGALGVLSAIEVMKSFYEEGIDTDHPIEVVSFSDEEGMRFKKGTIGSRGFIGILDENKYFALRDEQGKTLKEVMEGFGLNPDQIKNTFRKPEKLKCYVELHVEQSGKLAEGNFNVGVVEAIVGIKRLKITIKGEVDHPAIPMERRKDAFLGALKIVNEVEKNYKMHGFPFRYTVGFFKVFPCVANMVPGEVVFILELRDANASNLEKMTTVIRKQIQKVEENNQIEIKVDNLTDTPPTIMNKEIRKIIEHSYRKLKTKYRKTISVGGHDAMVFAPFVPAGMIFIANEGKSSHSPKERVKWENVETGAIALQDTILNLSQKSTIIAQ